MDKFLGTKKGLEYLLETFPSDMFVIDAINEAEIKLNSMI
jgi:hypothetical protein